MWGGGGVWGGGVCGGVCACRDGRVGCQAGPAGRPARAWKAACSAGAGQADQHTHPCWAAPPPCRLLAGRTCRACPSPSGKRPWVGGLLLRGCRLQQGTLPACQGGTPTHAQMHHPASPPHATGSLNPHLMAYSCFLSFPRLQRCNQGGRARRAGARQVPRELQL